MDIFLRMLNTVLKQVTKQVICRSPENVFCLK